MSFASEFRKKYFLDQLHIAKSDAGPEAQLPLRPDHAGDGAPEGDEAEAQRDEHIGSGGDVVLSEAEHPAVSESDFEQDSLREPPSHNMSQGSESFDHDPERLYQHEVIAPPPAVGPAETRSNFRRMLVAMLIATGLLAVLNSGALATYARGLPYGKVYERIIMGAEVWHGYMEQIGVPGIITTARDGVTAVRESRWADLAGLVGLADVPDVDRDAVSPDDGLDLSSELPTHDAGEGAAAMPPGDAASPDPAAGTIHQKGSELAD